MFGVWWSVLKLFPRPNGTRKAAIIILKPLYALQHQQTPFNLIPPKAGVHIHSTHAIVRNINTVGLSYFTVCLVYLLLLLLAMNTHAPCCCCSHYFFCVEFYRTNIRWKYSPLSNVDFHWIENCNHIDLENKSRFVGIAMNFSVCTAVKSNNM